MAIQIPIITSLEDAGIKAAKAAFNNFRQEVGNAEGAMGKFRAGSKVAFDAVKANAATFGIAAAGALVTFGAKAIAASQELALAADKMATATGLTTEEASRLMEVAGDLGIETSSVETTIGKMNQQLGKSPDLFEELGVQVAYASDGTVDANETFLNVVDRLKNIKDPAERAAVAAQLLGKGWRDMSQLINLGADDLRASLSSVSDAKTISPEEAERAKKFRDTMDDLKDSVEDLGLMLADVLVPILQKAADILTSDEAKQFFDDLGNGLGAIWRFGNDPVGHISDGVRDLASAAKDIPGDIWERNFGSEPQKQVAGLSSEMENFRRQEADTIDVSERLGLMERKKTEYLEEQQAVLAKKEYADKYIQNQRRIIEESNKTRDAILGIDAAWDRLVGNLTEQVALDQAEQQLADLEEAAAKAFASGSDSDLAKYNELAAQFVGTLANIAGGMGNISSREIEMRFKTSGNAAALDLARWLARGAEYANLSASQAIGEAGLSFSIPGRAMGGPVSAGGTYLVGERGPELLTLGSSAGYVTPNHELGGNTINITVTSADPNAVVAALQQYVRLNNRLPANAIG